jgi:hypothetical protein
LRSWSWRWAYAQTIAILAVCSSIIVGGYSITHGVWQGFPLAILLYMLHWRYQGLAFDINHLKSAEVVAIIKFRSNPYDPKF